MSPPTFLDVVSISSVSTWPSTTTCLLMPAPTCTVSVVLAVSVPRVWPFRLSAASRTRRFSRRLRSASRLPFRTYSDLPHGINESFFANCLRSEFPKEGVDASTYMAS